jgi:hypothetical protein
LWELPLLPEELPRERLALPELDLPELDRPELDLPELELFLELANDGVAAVRKESASKHGKKIRMHG